MKLTTFTDYALRTLVFLANTSGKQRIDDIASSYDISKNHLMKVVQELSAHNFIVSTRGRGGGLVLARSADAIIIGDVVRKLEETDKFVECQSENTTSCRIASLCQLRPMLEGATRAFMNHLDQFTLAQVIKEPVLFHGLFQPEARTIKAEAVKAGAAKKQANS